MTYNELVDKLYELNTRCDIPIEELASEITISMEEKSMNTKDTKIVIITDGKSPSSTTVKIDKSQEKLLYHLWEIGFLSYQEIDMALDLTEEGCKND